MPYIHDGSGYVHVEIKCMHAKQGCEQKYFLGSVNLSDFIKV